MFIVKRLPDEMVISLLPKLIKSGFEVANSYPNSVEIKYENIVELFFKYLIDRFVIQVDTMSEYSVKDAVASMTHFLDGAFENSLSPSVYTGKIVDLVFVLLIEKQKGNQNAVLFYDIEEDNKTNSRFLKLVRNVLQYLSRNFKIIHQTNYLDIVYSLRFKFILEMSSSWLDLSCENNELDLQTIQIIDVVNNIICKDCYLYIKLFEYFLKNDYKKKFRLSVLEKNYQFGIIDFVDKSTKSYFEGDDVPNEFLNAMKEEIFNKADKFYKNDYVANKFEIEREMYQIFPYVCRKVNFISNLIVGLKHYFLYARTKVNFLEKFEINQAFILTLKLSFIYVEFRDESELVEKSTDFIVSLLNTKELVQTYFDQYKLKENVKVIFSQSYEPVKIARSLCEFPKYLESFDELNKIMYLVWNDKYYLSLIATFNHILESAHLKNFSMNNPKIIYVILSAINYGKEHISTEEFRKVIDKFVDFEAFIYLTTASLAFFKSSEKIRCLELFTKFHKSFLEKMESIDSFAERKFIKYLIVYL